MNKFLEIYKYFLFILGMSLGYSATSLFSVRDLKYDLIIFISSLILIIAYFILRIRQK